MVQWLSKDVTSAAIPNPYLIPALTPNINFYIMGREIQTFFPGVQTLIKLFSSFNWNTNSNPTAIQLLRKSQAVYRPHVDFEITYTTDPYNERLRNNH